MEKKSASKAGSIISNVKYKRIAFASSAFIPKNEIPKISGDEPRQTPVQDTIFLPSRKQYYSLHVLRLWKHVDRLNAQNGKLFF